MNAALAHRGPDDEGYHLSPGAGLAARRLSIIDLPGGHQPLSSEDGCVWLAYNGEVYNHAGLRRDLEGRGHVFRTRTDTEAIVHAYEEWGEGCVGLLRGMFAFALWDERRERLLLDRDRFGIKPLYYGEAGGLFAFASELRSLLAALPGLPRRADPGTLWDLFGLGFVPSPRTLIPGVHKLPAAHYLLAERRNGTGWAVAIQSYWQLDYPRQGEHRDMAPEEATQAFVEKLREAVDLWRLSDVPVGSLLSGGIDSASLAALLQETIGGRIATFAIGFTAASQDEAAAARETARYLGSDHHELTFTPADFDRLPEVVRRLEEPQCSATAIPIYMLYQACRQAGYKVILTGEGSDELLGGYHWIGGDAKARPLLWLPRAARRLLAQLPVQTSPASRRVLAEGGADVLARYELWQMAVPPATRQSLISNLQSRPGVASRQWRAEFAAPLADRDPLDQLLFIDSRTRLVDFINATVDRMSMAWSVEARPPFLDHVLWEFTAKLPPRTKLRPSHKLGPLSTNKLLLRRGMAGRLPENVLRRPKLGLATPHAGWWRAVRLPAWAEDVVAPAALEETGYFNAAEFGRLRGLHRTGQADLSRTLTGVLATQLWHDEFAR
jgi:asparagine synthase (glutamine-hydrolysing)